MTNQTIIDQITNKIKEINKEYKESENAVLSLKERLTDEEKKQKRLKEIYDNLLNVVETLNNLEKGETYKCQD